MRPVALVGLRCSGKTTVGAELAHALGWPFVDLDEEVVELVCADPPPIPLESVSEILMVWGEPAFRNIEEGALRQVLSRGREFVLATGGGVVEREVNRSLLAQSCTCVWLDVPLVVLRERMEHDPDSRPALDGSDASGELAEFAFRRAGWYRRLAHLTVDCGRRGPLELAAEVAEWIRGRKGLDPGLAPSGAPDYPLGL